MASSGCRVERDGPVGRVILDRPETLNAFDERMIEALHAAADELAPDDTVRVVVITAEGRCFCAGADIDYMRRTGGFSEAENVADAQRLSAMFHAFDAIGKPLVCRVHGATFGGGCGLVAVSDLVIAGPRASFCLSEVRLGILPAVIGPYVARRVGVARARGLFSTALRVRSRDAVHLGLADILCDSDDDLDARVADVIESALACGPRAAQLARHLPDDVWGRPPAEVAGRMAALSAEARASAEGREGLGAFLAKRPAAWVPTKAPTA